MISKNKLRQIKALEKKKQRRESGLFVAEGPKVVGDLTGSFATDTIVATRDWLGSHRELLSAIGSQAGEKSSSSPEIIEVDDDELQRVSFLQHPQEVLAVMRIPRDDIDESAIKSRLCIALDGVQDPGNLGTIIRVADWFGITDIFCSRECADVYNPKVVQATMGSIARVKVAYTDLAALLDRIADDDIPVYGTFLDGEDIYGKALSDNGLIVMGNEGNGISGEIARRVNQRLYIPNFPEGRTTAESLNVAIATAITCAEFRRQHRK